MRDRERSLWLHPQRRPVEVRLERFRDYPHFFESFEQYGVRLPKVVTVVWKPLRPYLTVFEDEQDEDAEFIARVRRLIGRGADVPPLLVLKGRLFDGRHRAWAAWELGLRKAPVVDITPYWGLEQAAARVYG